MTTHCTPTTTDSAAGRAQSAVGKKEIAITEAAAQEIAKQRDKRGTPNARIRVGVRGGGCTGFTYVFEWADELKPTDKEFSAHGVVDRRRSEEPRVPRRHDARLRARDDGSRVQVQQPEREGLVRLWRERPVLTTRSGCSACPRSSISIRR